MTKGRTEMARSAQQDKQFWADHIARHQASGTSVREYCQRENLQAHHFYYYRKRSLTSAAVAPERPTASPQAFRQAKTASQLAAAVSTNRLAEREPSVVIRVADDVAVHVPAAMLETIEAVLRMAVRIGTAGSQSGGQGFRSIIVRT